MPYISNKANRMTSSPIRKLVPYAEKAAEDGKTVYYLNIGQPDIRTPEIVTEQINLLDMKIIGYSHSAGFVSLRKEMVNYYKKWGVALTQDQIIVTTGGSEALQFTFQVCFDPGDEVIIPEPFYANYNSFATSNDVVVKPVTARIETGFALPPVEEMEKKITKKTKGIMICNPSNPTGYLYTKEELEQLRQMVKKHDIFLFVDEVYREFCYDGNEPFSALKLKDVDDNVIVLDSVSKRYSMCGARIGLLVTKNKEVMEMAMKFAQARLSPPTIGQIAAEVALKTPQSYFDEVIEDYVERRNYMVGALNKMEGVVCPMPKGAFYAIAQLPIDNADKFCRWMLEEFSYKNQTLMMAPGTGFYATEGEGQQEVRLAYVLNIDSLKKAMKCLEEGLKAYPGRKISQGNENFKKAVVS